ncbi:MAG: hypothetical protein P0Y64_15510 [Candidatus Sphingomonas colombiensis]|nr:hypothetical protein [Sphingomonas sp.]WEK42753.1 MAG: hypothetical protein P0Y64_15510 [Sphingomonas sp.]
MRRNGAARYGRLIGAVLGVAAASAAIGQQQQETVQDQTVPDNTGLDIPGQPADLRQARSERPQGDGDRQRLP